MSRTGRPVGRIMQRFPCLSGDEPDLEAELCKWKLFSPRERG